MPTELWFHEQMTGFFAKGATDPRVGYEQGKKDGTWFGFELTIYVDDLDRFIADPTHKARVEGRYLGNLFPGEPPVQDGTFNFMSPGPGASRKMEHHHAFTWEGQAFHFDGEKDIESSALAFDEIADLTTLYSRITDAATGRVVAAGILRFPMKDFPKLVASFDARGDDDPFIAKMKFLRFFLHEEAYVILSGYRPVPAPRERRRTLSRPHAELADVYDVVVVGSGYGGGAVAARLAGWEKNGKRRSVAVFERGREWRAGDFPDEPWELAASLRSPHNPSGLVDFAVGRDIDVVTGSGLGGTSLINANVMVRPEATVFRLPAWPRDLPDLGDHFARAAKTLHARVDPSPPLKGEVFREAASRVPGASGIEPTALAVTFEKETRADTGNTQTACTHCGGCVTGCNYTSKNTVDMTYLSIAEKAGAKIFTGLEVARIERLGDGYTLHVRDHEAGGDRVVHARQVVLSAGVLGSFGILARSARAGLDVSDTLGSSFSGNGDVLGFAYNTDKKTDVNNGPTISSIARFAGNADVRDDFIVEEGGIPRALMAVVRGLLPVARDFGVDTDEGFVDRVREWLRVQADRLGFDTNGALNNSLVYLGMGFEEAAGKLTLEGDSVKVVWPDVGSQPFAKRVDDAMYALTSRLGGTYIRNPDPRSFLTKHLITVHPLGGCPMGASRATGVVNAKGEVFGHEGGLYVADGSIVPTPLGVNPALTIAALAEHIADGIANEWSAKA